MTTPAEIKAAIETLPDSEAEELSVWLNDRQYAKRAHSAHDVIAQQANGRSIWDFVGAFNTGDPRSSDNERIDADLAREAGRGLSDL